MQPLGTEIDESLLYAGRFFPKVALLEIPLIFGLD
jgi:hypothetical protein